MNDHARDLSSLSFCYPWRTYQRLMLARIEQLDQPRLHLVAPPGSGKTIVGLELIRRAAGPAVVFSPTTTIAAQWADKINLFTDDPTLASSLCSAVPDALSTINVFTYQRIATQDTTDRTLETAARAAWVDQLVIDDQAPDLDAATERIEVMAANNPSRYRQQLRRRTRALRRQLIDEGGDVTRYLHANAVALIDALVDLRVATVVLDECHHLLDHWALVVRALLDRLPDVQVVGLTATPPDPDDATSYDNYTALLGDVDFEVPTPAVVVEGDLAPWRDLAYFVQPTAAEAELLTHTDRAFSAAVMPLLDDVRLLDWATESLAGGDHPTDHLAAVLAARPALSIAQGRLLHAAGRWPRTLPAPSEVADPLDFDDQLVLIERFGLDVLALSDDPADHSTLKQIREALRGFGLSLTERGLRHGRSAGDLVLALSAAKDAAVVDILTREAADLDRRLRAVVVTDFAEMTSAVSRAAGALASDAGSATRVFHALIDDPATEQLDPMLVTGSSVLVDADHGDELLDALNARLEFDGISARCEYRPTDHPQVLEIVGSGPGWSPSTYVRLITEVFDDGTTRCLVGTRGLFGEGWDSLSLNTLVDLTAVTTSTGVQQLRGRSIRLDPQWRAKVSHNWDVVCVAPDHSRGDTDLQRLIRRHSRTWGVVPEVVLTDYLRAARPSLALGEPVAGGNVGGCLRPGRIVKGVSHVSPLLAWQLATQPLDAVAFASHTATSLRAIGRRAQSHELWGIGSEYDNFVTRATVLSTADLTIRTVHTVTDTLKALLARVGAAAVLGVTFGLYYGIRRTAGSFAELVVSSTAGALLGLAVLLVVNRRDVVSLTRKLFVEQPSDAILLDVGRATLTSLQHARLLSEHLQPEYVRVAEQEDGTCEVQLDYASESDAATFIDAYRQLFAPVTDQRYLVRRTDTRLPSLPLSAVWLPIRAVTHGHLGRPGYHPVPDVLSVNRDRADAFAAAWRRYVGGGELIYTRTPEGRVALLGARSGTQRTAKSLAFDRWR